MSKALEALEDIILYLNASEPKGLYCENIETIQQALLEAQKELKALEIIKEKLVDVFKLYNCNTVEEYNQAQYRDCILTQEEFNLLKEVLE